MVEKMARWTYDPFELKIEVNEDILKAVTIQWNNVVQTKKDIREQTLRRVMLEFSDKDIKDAMKNYERRHTPRFRNFQILGKKVEDVVQVTTMMWKTIFKVVDLDDNEDEKDKEEKDDKDQDIKDSQEPSIEIFVQVIKEKIPDFKQLKNLMLSRLQLL